MPFYVDYSRKRRTIWLKRMAPDQFIFCYPYGDPINLEGILNDYFNHRNVEFFWEQIKGNPMVFDHNGDYFTSYPYTDTTDKIFRLYIDKDTNREQFKDTRIFHTPTSFDSKFVPHKGTANIPATITDIVMNPASLAATLSRMVVPTVEAEPATLFQYTLPTEATLINYPEKMELYHSLEATHIPGTVLETFLPPYDDFFVAAKGFYKLRFYYDLPDNEDLYYDSQLLISNPAPVTDTAGSHTTDDLYISPTIKINLLSLTRFSAKIFNGGTENLYRGGVYHTSGRIIRYEAKFQSYVEDDPMLYSTLFARNHDFTLLRVNPSGVGHGF